jgi:isopentenyldiphosphate isomerase
MCERKKELWDIYTKERVKTGRFHVRGEKMQEGDYHLAVHICIFNNKNEMLIQKRQSTKEDWANMWDLSAAGSAIAGDTSSQAAEREVFEELGLKIDLSNTRPFFTVNFPEGFDDYYLIRQEVDIAEIKLQEEEVQEVKWASKEEVMELFESGEFIPYWFLDKLFYIANIEGAFENSDILKNCKRK